MADGPGWAAEEELWARGAGVVAGCDEAGRGPLAGPVVAAAVVVPRELTLKGLNDSKKLDAARREDLFSRVCEGCRYGVGVAEADEIDRLNILRASLLAMHRAVLALDCEIEGLVVDGKHTVPGLTVEQLALPKGDARSVSVAAASIVAKVTRDAIMVRLEADHPGYGFAQHKGYPSPEHLEALQRLGPCAAHRTSFAPVRALLPEPPPLPPARSRGATSAQLRLFEGDDDG